MLVGRSEQLTQRMTGFDISKMVRSCSEISIRGRAGLRMCSHQFERAVGERGGEGNSKSEELK
jgi:hypothetical protein